MAFEALYGLGGKIKTLTDRLTAGRASNLDNLDATVSTRAPASTALLRSVWSDIKAGYLDTAISSRASQTSLNTLQSSVNALTDAAISKHAEVYVSGNGSTSRYNVNLGVAFDIGKSLVQVSTPILGSTSNPEPVHVAWSWTSTSQLTIQFYSLGSTTVESIPTNAEFYVTVKEFIE